MHKLQHSPGSRSCRTRSHSTAQRGMISLEFLILMPVVLTILIGIMDFSLMMYDKAALATAARATARDAIMVRSSPYTTTTIIANGNANALNAVISGTTTTAPSTSATQTNGSNTGSTLTVTITYTYRGLLLGSALSAVTGPIVLTEAAVMNYE